ncbi:stage V sporulation protein AA [Tissierella creatinophila]|uniref:Stage V sporulation protein AA n=1 Tax=Tissierella creatinophila DSM 6911 TaxID=1123403 RepID=A0A1U7M6B5_TISCR|nr:stage V sporulation protein AA [Tissierella creatinophila]OLS02863.1 stage V sporulation protein AA [Tissierella creatinophila DSM 6911]
MSNENVYIALDNKKTVEIDKDIYIKDIAKVRANNPGLQKKIEDLRIYKSKRKENWDYISADEIIQKIEEKYKDININMLGASEVLMEIKSLEDKTGLLQFLKVLAICIILFLGAAIAIINFHEDVNMQMSLEKIYYTVSGEKKDKPLIMTIPYSIGMGVGVAIFFSRVISKSERRRKEPGPMEIELFLYNKDMEQCILNELSNNEDKK